MAKRSLAALLGDAESPEAPSNVYFLPQSKKVDMALAGDPYQGASRINREVALWLPELRSANQDILPAREIATARARDVLRNDGMVNAAMVQHKDSIVGAMYALNVRPNMRVLGIKDEQWEAEFQEEIESKWFIEAESPLKWIDASRMNTFTQLVRLVVGVYLYSGEVLASAEWVRQSSRPFKTAIQLIESDRLSNELYAPDRGRTRGGVERDRYGAPQAYWIRDAHASEYLMESTRWTRYPAFMSWGRRRIIHILEQQRIDQTRGISDMVAALKEMKMSKQFRDIVLQNAVVNATFAASIESDLPRDQAFEAIAGDDPDKAMDYAQTYLEAIAEYSKKTAGGLTIDGVRIPHLFPGTKLQLRPAGKGGPLGSEFESSLHRYTAANLGLTYEEYSRDFSKANYSSFRGGLQSTKRYMASRKKYVADAFANEVFRLWFEEKVNAGQIESMKGRPDIYEGSNLDAYTQCSWLGAGMGQIEELKETQAATLRIRNNLSTIEAEAARLGHDWRYLLKQRKREQELLKEYDLLPEENTNMENASTGAVREKNDTGGNVEDDSQDVEDDTDE